MTSPLAPTFTCLDPCSGDNADDLRCKLMYTSLELQKVQAEGRLQESELWRLQELLNIMKKERDEALEECRRLQEYAFLQQRPAMGVDSASSFMHSSSMVSSPSSSPWSLQELEEHLNSDDFCPAYTGPAPSELQQALESLVQSCDKGQSLFCQMQPGNEDALYGSEQEIQMDILDQALCFDAPPCLNLPELQVKDERVSAVSASVRSLSRQSSSNSSSACVQSLEKRQVSMDSLDAVVGLSSAMAKSLPAIAMAGILCNVPPPSLSSVGCNAVYETQQILPVTSLVDSSASTLDDESLLLMLTRGSCGLKSNNGTSSNVSSVTNHISSPSPSTCENGASAAVDAPPAPKLCLANNERPTNNSAPCLTAGNAESVSLLINTNSPLRSSMGCKTPTIPSECMVKSMAGPTTWSMTENVPLTASASLATALSTGAVPASKTTCMSSASCYPPQASPAVRQFHLPEPPEADPQVMLNSLPEKGKLLQAVMQAGPLLQTLLLAGPLPQWRYPPPAISTRDIPKVSLAPGHVLFTPSSMQGAVSCNTMMTNGSPSTITRKRIAIMEPSLQNKKLRKLSPSPSRKGKAIRMVSAGERQGLASGSLSQLAGS